MALTAFFRDMQSLHYVVSLVVPELLGRSRIRIWDAGCASGEEPFSLSMLCAEHLGYFGFSNVVILATDHEESQFPQFRESIAQGIFPEMVLKTTPRPDLLRKYSRPAARPGYIQIADEIRARIVYQQHDLLSYQEVGSDFSLVVCKNVLLHFQPPQRVEVVRMFHRSLAPGGYLVLDQAQPLPAGTEDLWVNVADGGFLFRKSGESG